MIAKLLSLSKKVSVDTTIPNGTYTGVWGGYVVQFEHDGETYEAKTDVGVKGINIPCTINIEGTDITVKSW